MPSSLSIPLQGCVAIWIATAWAWTEPVSGCLEHGNLDVSFGGLFIFHRYEGET